MYDGLCYCDVAFREGTPPIFATTPTTGASGGDDHYPLLANNDLVSDADGDVHYRPGPSSASPSASSSRKRQRSAYKESALVPDGVASKRLHMIVKEGHSTSCAQDLLAATIAPSTKKHYQLQQREFTSWMQAAGHDQDLLV
jgi:hypothetical protein